VISQGIIGLLLSAPAVTGLVGTRIGPKKVVQGTAEPYLIVKQAGGDHAHSFSGRAGLGTAHLLITAWDLTTEKADHILDVVGTFLDGFSGRAASAGQSFRIRGIFQSDDAEDWAAPIHSDEVGKHSATAGFKVLFDE
jgi:hypothetical protein